MTTKTEKAQKENSAHYTGYELSNHNMCKIEQYISEMEIIPAVKHGILMSLIYTGIARVLGSWVTLNDSQIASDDQNINENAMARNEALILRNEHRMQEAADIVGWAQAQLPEENKINTDEIASFFMDNKMTSKHLAKDERKIFSELLGISEKEAELIYNMSADAFAERMNAQKEALKQNATDIEKIINAAMNPPSIPEFEISDEFAQKLLDKMVIKMDLYAQRRIQYAAAAFSQGNMRRFAEIAGEKKLLEKLAQTGANILKTYEGADA